MRGRREEKSFITCTSSAVKPDIWYTSSAQFFAIGAPIISMQDLSCISVEKDCSASVFMLWYKPH
jgi:hypothetical protein